jgi:hypothetical protein
MPSDDGPAPRARGEADTALTASNATADTDDNWAGTGFSAPGPVDPEQCGTGPAWTNDAWVAGYAAGVEFGLEEYVAVAAERDRLANDAERLRIERDEYAAQAHAAEQEVSATAQPGRGEPPGREAEAG